MSFDAETFPSYPMIHGLQREVVYPVRKRSNGSVEWRGTHVRFERYRWTIPTQTMTVAQRDAIHDFLVQRSHGINSFRFIDPMWRELDDVLLTHNTGSDWNLYLPLEGDDDTANTLHPMFNLVQGELTVTVNGSPGTISGLDVTDGIPVIDVPGTSGGETVRLSGNLYFTVHLEDNINSALLALKCSTNDPFIYTMSAITLLEVHQEYT